MPFRLYESYHYLYFPAFIFIVFLIANRFKLKKSDFSFHINKRNISDYSAISRWFSPFVSISVVFFILEILYARRGGFWFSVLDHFHRFNWYSMGIYVVLLVLSRIAVIAAKKNILYDFVNPLLKIMAYMLAIIGIADFINYDYFHNRVTGISFFPDDDKLSVIGIIKIGLSLYLFLIASHYQNIYTDNANTQIGQDSQDNQ
jgi:hypothetical protein